MCPLPLPILFLTHSPPPPPLSGVPSFFFFFFLQYPLPERPEQPVCPSRLSECATSRLDTLHGRRDRDGPRGDPALRRPPKQINTAKRRQGRAADMDEANRQFCGGCFFFFFQIDGILAAKMEMGAKGGHRERREHLGWQNNSATRPGS